MIDSLLSALTPKQAVAVAFVSAFVTVIGGICLALWYRRKNKMEKLVEKLVD